MGNPRHQEGSGMSYTMTAPQFEVWSESVPGGQYGNGQGTRLQCQGLFANRADAESYAERLSTAADSGTRYWCNHVWIRAV